MMCQAILVNYHGAALTCGAAHSLGAPPEVRIDVVDNSTSAAEQALLRTGLPSHANLRVPEKNIGFGRACNLAFESDNSEFVLLLNPDARLLPGALEIMIGTLRADVTLGAVGPRVYWDDSKRFMMPLSTYPSRSWFLRSNLGTQAVPFWAHLAARRFRRNALSAWQASRPFVVDALSGGHVLLRRSAVIAAGGLFDPDFFMYWEDSDLMCRLKSAGYRLAQDPRAEAVHLYSHSPSKDALIQAGWETYARKHYDSTFWKLISGIKKQSSSPTRTAFPARPLTWTSENIALGVPEAINEWLLEISPSSDFVPAIGSLGTGRTALLPAALASRFSGCTLFLRLSPATPKMPHAMTWVLKVPSPEGR